MKLKTIVLAMLMFVLTFSVQCANRECCEGQTNEVDYWAVIVCTVAMGRGDAAYAYHVLSTHYAFNDIYYLSYDTNISEVDAKANSTNFRWAITNWLMDKADSNPYTDDVMFIYVIAHGAGIAYPVPQEEEPNFWGDNLTLYDGYYDDNFDECYNSSFEIEEAHVVDRWNNPVDVNGDNRTFGWVGIDEAIKFDDNNVTDDELASDLDTLNGKYETLIFATQQCMGGGLIDDLSGPNRIIMTAVDETHLAAGDIEPDGQPLDGLSEWSEAFFDALHGEDTSYNAGTDELVHEGEQVDADYNDDGHVSMLEVFNYTSSHTFLVQGYNQTEWLDDNGDRLPTYVNETDYGSDCDTGALADATWFPRKNYNLTVETRLTSEAEVQGVNVWIDGNLTEGSPVINYTVTAEGHDIQVQSPISWQGRTYYFAYWNDGHGGNPTHIHVDEDKTITAYYSQSPTGCPFVYTWNGTHYVIDNNLLAASAWSNGEEVEDYYKLEQSLVPVYEGDLCSLYSLRLNEFQQEHSYFDQVQLIVVDHNSDFSVAVSPFGEILTYQNPYAPLSAVDDQGNDQTELIQDVDESYYEGCNGSYLLLNFGVVDAENAKLVMRADRPPSKTSIHIQVLDSAENWIDVVAIIPRTYWATEIVDLSSYLSNSTGEFKLRLFFTENHKVDYVGLDTTPQAQTDVQDAHLLLAYHSDEGIVTTRLLNNDDFYAELTPEQHMILLFSAPKQSEKQRTFIIYVKGYYITIMG